MVYVFPIERDSQKAIIAGAVIFSLLPTAAVVLRMVARPRLRGLKIWYTLDLSDWLILLACVVTVAYQLLAVACAVVGGMGYHTTEVLAMGGPESFTLLMELVTVVVLFWSLSLGLTKLSILALYAKIFDVGKFVLISQACAAFVVIWAMILFVGAFTMCSPVEYNWDKFWVMGTCGDVRMLWAVTGGLNIFTDLVVMLLPMPYIYGLSLQMYKKIGLMVTFGIGLAVCIVGAVRLSEIIKIDMNDFPYSGGIALIFSALEPCLLVTAACVPLLRPLVSRDKSTDKANSDATGNNKNKVGAPSAAWADAGGFSKLPDDDGSTKQLHMGHARYGADKNHTNIQLKTITVKRDWRVEDVKMREELS